MSRLPITKTPKPYVGGSFIRSESVKRVHFTDLEGAAWFKTEAESVYAIRDFLEFKTTWHPIGA